MTYWLHSFPVFIIRFTYISLSRWKKSDREIECDANKKKIQTRQMLTMLLYGRALNPCLHIHFLLLLNDMPVNFILLPFHLLRSRFLVSLLFLPRVPLARDTSSTTVNCAFVVPFVYIKSTSIYGCAEGCCLPIIQLCNWWQMNLAYVTAFVDILCERNTSFRSLHPIRCKPMKL